MENQFDVFLWANEIDEIKIMSLLNYFYLINTIPLSKLNTPTN